MDHEALSEEKTFTEEEKACPGRKKGRRFVFVPRTVDQQNAFDLCRRNTVTFLTGEAGTGKTHAAMAAAVYDVDENLEHRIVLIRPAVTAGEDHGFLTGDLAEKLAPWIECFKDCLVGLGNMDHSHFLTKYASVEALAYMRGRTFTKRTVILDEAQNCSGKQLRMVLQRLGLGGRIIIVGDEEQQDRVGPSLLEEAAGLLEGLQVTVGADIYSAARMTLHEQCRHPFLHAMNERLRQLGKPARTGNSP